MTLTPSTPNPSSGTPAPVDAAPVDAAPVDVAAVDACLACHLRVAPTCDGTLRETERWLAQHPHSRWVLTRVKRLGGYCDCEVLVNALPEMAFVSRDLVLRCLLSFVAEGAADPDDPDDRTDNTDVDEELWGP